MRVEHALRSLWRNICGGEDGYEVRLELLVRVAAGELGAFVTCLGEMSVEEDTPALLRVLGGESFEEMQPVEKVVAGLILV